MDQQQAAARLGMKAAEIIGVERAADAHVVTTHDGQRVRVTADGVEPYREAPPTDAKMEPPAEQPAPDGDVDQVPEGSAETVLQWVGDDPGRARLALEAEQAKASPRRGLVDRLQKVQA